MKRLLLLLVGAALLPAVAFADTLPQNSAADRGASYLAGLQQPGGGFDGASLGQDMDTVVAIRAAGYDPETLAASDGATPADFIEANAPGVTKAGDASKLALGAVAVGLDPASVSGVDLQAIMSGAFDASTGRYAADDFSQSIVMLGLACTGGDVPADAVSALESAQVQADGGWGFQGASDPDTTAIALQALLASGVPASDPVVSAALGYFQSSQLDDGGWGYPPASNVNSTAYVVQALLAAGEDPSTYIKGGVDPVAYLLSQQQADGSFPGFSIPVSVAQVVPALAGHTYCDAASAAVTHDGPPARADATPTPTATASTTPDTTTPVTTPTTTATAPTTNTPATTATPAPSKTTQATRTPAAPATGSGASGNTPGAPILVGALALFAAAMGLSAFALRKDR